MILANNILHHTLDNGRVIDIHFIARRDDSGEIASIEALCDDGYLFNYVGSRVVNGRSWERIAANDGCLWERESCLVDEMLMAGCFTVTGRITDDGWYAEVKLNDEWLNTIYIRPNEEELGPNKLAVNVGNDGGHRYRSASMIHGDYQWDIEENNPYFSRFGSDHGYLITVTSTKDDRMSANTRVHRSLVDAWFEAMRYEKVLTELVDEGDRIAAQVGLSFFDMLTKIAASNWYLEG